MHLEVVEVVANKAVSEPGGCVGHSAIAQAGGKGTGPLGGIALNGRNHEAVLMFKKCYHYVL